MEGGQSSRKIPTGNYQNRTRVQLAKTAGKTTHEGVCTQITSLSIGVQFIAPNKATRTGHALPVLNSIANQHNVRQRIEKMVMNRRRQNLDRGSDNGSDHGWDQEIIILNVNYHI